MKQRRSQLAECIRTGTDPLESIRGLIQINCPLKEKFAVIKGFSELLIKNSEVSSIVHKCTDMLSFQPKKCGTARDDKLSPSNFHARCARSRHLHNE